jgi:hypothetical protein
LYNQTDERAVLGVLLEKNVAPEGLTRDHFTNPACLAVFDTVQRLSQEGRPVDLPATLDAMKSAGTIERAGGELFLDGLVEAAPPAAHLGYHIERLNLALQRRLLHHAGLKLQDAAVDGKIDSADLLDTRCSGILAELAGPDNPRAVLDAADWLQLELPAPSQVLKGAFDLNTKTCITGPSKARKSFFLLQLAVSVAGGLHSFLDWKIEQHRIVLYANLEIPEAHFQRRLRRMAKAMGVEPAQLKGRLHIMNARGKSGSSVLTRIQAEAKRIGAEVIIIDPVYKLIPGDESKQENVKALLSTMDRICNATNAALVYVHHGTKGEQGDRLTIDRAAGSGVLARDVDCLISLANHVTDGLLVVEQIARSYAPKEAFSIRWDTEADCFLTEAGTPPTVRTSFNRRRTGVGTTITDEDAVRLVSVKPLTSGQFDDALETLGLSRDAARRMKARLVDAGTVKQHKSKTWPTSTYYGIPAGIEKLKYETENPQLPQLRR